MQSAPVTPLDAKRTPRVGRDAELALQPVLALAFAPLHKKAFGIAVGAACALIMFLLTAVWVVRAPAREYGPWLLAQFFAGYRVTWAGAVVGALWGFGVGFVMGWFVAFCRNLVLAISIFAIRTRAQLRATRDFLDHI